MSGQKPTSSPGVSLRCRRRHQASSSPGCVPWEGVQRNEWRGLEMISGSLGLFPWCRSSPLLAFPRGQHTLVFIHDKLRNVAAVHLLSSKLSAH